eukprot:766203-Hanusia_phi.AAC.5
MISGTTLRPLAIYIGLLCLSATAAHNSMDQQKSLEHIAHFTATTKELSADFPNSVDVTQLPPEDAIVIEMTVTGDQSSSDGEVENTVAADPGLEPAAKPDESTAVVEESLVEITVEAEGASVEQEAVEQEAVEQEAVEQEAVEQEAVEQEAVEQEAVEQEAVEQEAVEQTVASVETTPIQADAESLPVIGDLDEGDESSGSKPGVVQEGGEGGELVQESTVVSVQVTTTGDDLSSVTGEAGDSNESLDEGRVDQKPDSN